MSSKWLNPFFRPPRKPKLSNIWKHAVLDSNGRIITIALYPRSERQHSKSVIPIPDSGFQPRVGDYYVNGKFQREKPE